MIVYMLDGRPIDLLDKSLSRGGEGQTYEFQKYRNVAKIYTDSKTAPAREAKIKELIKFFRQSNVANSTVMSKIAPPLFPLFDAHSNFVGFGMKKAKADANLVKVYEYPPTDGTTYSIKTRIKILINLCAAIEELHNLRYIVGDMNPNNIMVNSTTGDITIIDVDSMQIRSTNGTDCRCVVCAPGYVAPEVIRKVRGYSTYAAYPGEVFTIQTDYFALAIHCFRMLFHGFHPYSVARVAGNVVSVPAPLSEDHRVEMGQTPFFTSVPGFKPPVFAPDVRSLPPYLYKLFYRAFVEGTSDPSARPTAGEWKDALTHYLSDIVECSSDPSHYYWRGYQGGCPYCEAEARCR